MARSRVASEERIFSLVLALVASTSGLRKHELLSSVYGYSDRYRDEAQRVALDRQFERDKEQLRALGIPVETIESPGEPGNNQLARYRISKAALEVPTGLSFTDRELMLLRMATLAWREGSLTQEARRAAMKLESLGVGIDAPSLGVNAGFGTSEPSAPALLAAIEHEQTVSFVYKKPGEKAPSTRSVLPLQLHRFEGRWHLISFDLDRRATRVFLLSRVIGPVTTHDGCEERPVSGPIAALITEAVDRLHELQRTQIAEVRVRRHSEAAALLSPRATDIADESDTQVIRFGTTDMHELAALLAGFGSDAQVLTPPNLRREVTHILRTLLGAHAGLTTPAVLTEPTGSATGSGVDAQHASRQRRQR